MSKSQRPQPNFDDRFAKLTSHGQWSAVQAVSHRLREEGFQALLAGGCVRDLIMGREPNDFDVATDATPDQVHAIYPHALTVGKAFGVTILPFTGFHVEVATFREDLEYRDGRRPEGVRFSSPEEDAKRRDFTVNALFYDVENHKMIDYVGGEADIARRLIRTVGEPERRFTEDRLRLLRAVRFAAQLDFTIDPETLQAIERLAPQVTSVSRERVRDEIVKLLKSPHRRKGFELMLETGLLRALFPTLAEEVGKNPEAWLNRLSALSHEETCAGLALFFQPLFAPDKEHELRHDILKPLKLDNKLIDAIVFALAHATDFLEPDRHRLGDLVLLLANPASAAAREIANILEREKTAQSGRDQNLEVLAGRVLGPERKKPKPFVTGALAKSLGLEPGEKMGQLLNEAYLLQLEGKIKDSAGGEAWLKEQMASRD